MFEAVLVQMINPAHELCRLASEIDWGFFEREFAPLYSGTGRPAHPIRRMVGFLIIKQLYNQSDEGVVARWVENPYWQHFTGEAVFRHRAPFDPSELVHFRNRIGGPGAEKILKESIRIHGKSARESEVVVDTTVQEKAVTFPTDAKLRRKVVDKCIAIARKEGLKLSRTYAKERKSLMLKLRFRNHPKRRKEARKAERRLLTIAGRILRDLGRKLEAAGQLWVYTHEMGLFNRVLSQRRKDKDKVYSLHEPTVSCIAKGKDHKPYEFGCKVSVATTKTRGIVVGALAFDGNPYDGDTLDPTLGQVEELTGKRPSDAIADRGYRGRKQLGTTKVHIPSPPPAGQHESEARRQRKRFRRRAAIEPRIGHLKHDYRLGRNFLKGDMGDVVNLLMAAAAWNLRLWIMAKPAPALRLPGLMHAARHALGAIKCLLHAIMAATKVVTTESCSRNGGIVLGF
jgi:IS5 family transposase